jgi:succinyl-diaminopimelate desuccinylase
MDETLIGTFEAMEQPGDLRARVLAALDEAELVGLARTLIAIDSTNPPGCEQRMAEALAAHAAAGGLDVNLVPVTAGRSNVHIRLRGGSSASRMAYCGHLDTVVAGASPWQRDPFGAEIVDGVLWGRGAVDMKSGLAAMLGALLAIHRSEVRLNGTVELIALVGEEVDCAGATHLMRTGSLEGVQWLVVGEPTGLEVAIAHKGCVRLRVTTRGAPAHASRPDLGRNAILDMAALLPELSRVDLSAVPHALLTPATAAVTTVSGGSAVNVVPDCCSAEFDIRVLPGQTAAAVVSQFEEQIDAVAARTPGLKASVEVFYQREAVETKEDHPLVVAVQETAQSVFGRPAKVRAVDFFTDASVLQPPTGIPTVLFGPGDIGLMHQADERVLVRDIIAASQVFAVLPARLL